MIPIELSEGESKLKNIRGKKMSCNMLKRQTLLAIVVTLILGGVCSRAMAQVNLSRYNSCVNAIRNGNGDDIHFGNSIYGSQSDANYTVFIREAANTGGARETLRDGLGQFVSVPLRRIRDLLVLAPNGTAYVGTIPGPIRYDWCHSNLSLVLGLPNNTRLALMVGLRCRRRSERAGDPVFHILLSTFGQSTNTLPNNSIDIPMSRADTSAEDAIVDSLLPTIRKQTEITLSRVRREIVERERSARRGDTPVDQRQILSSYCDRARRIFRACESIRRLQSAVRAEESEFNHFTNNCTRVTSDGVGLSNDPLSVGGVDPAADGSGAH